MSDYNDNASPVQIPFPGKGLNVHDCLPAQKDDEAIRKRVADYDIIEFEMDEAGIARWANRHPAASGRTDREILNYLAFLSTRSVEPYCKISQAKIAQKVGCSRMTVSRRLSRLKDLKAIEWTNRKSDGGTQAKNEYYVPLHKDWYDKSRVTKPCNKPCNSRVTSVYQPCNKPCNSRVTSDPENGFPTRAGASQYTTLHDDHDSSRSDHESFTNVHEVDTSSPQKPADLTGTDSSLPYEHPERQPGESEMDYHQRLLKALEH